MTHISSQPISIDEMESVFVAGRQSIIDPRQQYHHRMSVGELTTISGNKSHTTDLIRLLTKRVDDILCAFGLPYGTLSVVEPTPQQVARLCELPASCAGGHLAVHTTPHGAAHVYLSEETWRQLSIVARAYYERFGEPITLLSGYRSVAYQVYLICYNGCREWHDGRVVYGSRPLSDVFQTVAPPHCSEHELVPHPAFDLKNFSPGYREGDPTISEIRASEQYRFFVAIARKYGILETYGPRTINNGDGEPWHFRLAC